MKWTFPSLNLDIPIVANRGMSVKNQNKMANSADPDETAERVKLNI